MNVYIAIGLILIIIGLYFMPKKKDDTPALIEDENFCVKVKPFALDHFCVVFSNDGFKTEEQYEEMLGNYGWGQVALFYSQSAAIDFAKSLKSYKQCVDHNKIIKDNTKKWHKKREQENHEEYKKWEERPDKEVIIKCDQTNN